MIVSYLSCQCSDTSHFPIPYLSLTACHHKINPPVFCSKSCCCYDLQWIDYLDKKYNIYLRLPIAGSLALVLWYLNLKDTHNTVTANTCSETMVVTWDLFASATNTMHVLYYRADPGNVSHTHCSSSLKAQFWLINFWVSWNVVL